VERLIALGQAVERFYPPLHYERGRFPMLVVKNHYRALLHVLLMLTMRDKSLNYEVHKDASTASLFKR
jgi:hypothetical protein